VAIPLLARALGGAALRGRSGGSRARNVLRIDGIEQLKDNLARMIPGEAQKILRKAAVDVANLIRDDIRAALPGNVRHYRLAIQTYRPRLRRGEIAADVVAKRTPPRAFYIHNIVESGTKARFTKGGAARGAVTAQPFKKPVVDRWRSKVPGAFEEALSRGLTAAWARRRTGAK
jgi:hypothetical protein